MNKRGMSLWLYPEQIEIEKNYKIQSLKMKMIALEARMKFIELIIDKCDSNRNKKRKEV